MPWHRRSHRSADAPGGRPAPAHGERGYPPAALLALLAAASALLTRLFTLAVMLLTLAVMLLAALFAAF